MKNQLLDEDYYLRKLNYTLVFFFSKKLNIINLVSTTF